MRERLNTLRNTPWFPKIEKTIGISRITKSTSKLKWALIDEEAGVCPQNPSNRYNRTFFHYAGRSSWSDHCQHRSGQGQNDCRHGYCAACGWTGHARAHVAISEGVVALRRARCSQSIRR